MTEALPRSKEYSMPQIRLEGIARDYRAPDRDLRTVHAVHSVDLTIEQGEFVFVTGSSGAGKSTLLELITCRLRPTAGSVWLDGANLTRMPGWRRARRCRCMGYVPQYTELVRRQTVAENLLEAARAGRRRGAQPPAVRAHKALGLVGLSEAVGGRYPGELTLAETRRADLALAIVNNPEILVLDELTANLSDDDAWDMFLFLSELNRHGVTIVMASNARKYVNLLRRRVLTLVDGAILGDMQKGRYGNVIG